MSAIKSVPPSPEIEGLLKPLQNLATTNGLNPVDFLDNLYTPEDQNAFFRDMTLYFLGSESQAAFLSQVDGLAVHSANANVALNDKTKVKTGTWDLTKW